MSSSVVQYHTRGGGAVVQPRTAEEEWVTTKKVEIVTTKNVERKIQRQVVLDDGRVVEEEIPTITVDTTEDKQTFETDQDEERNLEGEGNTRLASRFDTSGGVLVGDKFTSVKKINDVRENLVKTEAMQNLGNIANRDITKVLDKGDDIRKYLRSKQGPTQQVSVAPRTVFSSRNHKVVTDKEDVQERNWVNKGKMQNERIKTEEHIEYDSDDSPDDGSSSSSSKSSHHKLEPEIYKTRKDENFTEYFKVGKDNNNKPQTIKVGDGPHYTSESKEVQREDDIQLSQQPFRPTRAKQMPRHLLAEVDANNRMNKKPVNNTDSWLERHFGSTSSLSASSVELSRPGSREGYGLRRSASICDIRPVDSSSNVFYATVRKSGKVPEVKLREKKPDSNYNTANRVSANFSSSGHPVRPPRRNKKSDYEEFSNSGLSEKPDPVYGSLRKSNPPSTRSQSAQVTEKYYFGNPVTIKKSSKPSQSPGGLTRSFSSVQNLHSRPQQPGHHASTGNIYHPTSGSRSELHSSVVKSNSRFKQNMEGEERRVRNRDGDAYQVKSREGDERKVKNRKGDAHNNENKEGLSKQDRNRVVKNKEGVPYQIKSREVDASKVADRDGDAYRAKNKEGYTIDSETSSREAYKVKNRSGKYFTSSQSQIRSDERRDRTGSRQSLAFSDKVHYSTPQDRNIYDTPHRIIYTPESPVGTPSTKFRTKIVINGEA